MEIAAESVAAWSGVEVIRALTGGARNPVFLADRDGQQLVVRRSARSPAALDWELDLLEHLRELGIGVPRLVPSDDGRRHVGGVLIHHFIEGRRPRDSRDCRSVVEVLTAVHESTVGWPQRPRKPTTQGHSRSPTAPRSAASCAPASFRGRDEYQECGGSQHALVAAVSEVLPVAVFGDPLQSIFDFGGNVPVDWTTHVTARWPSLDLPVRGGDGTGTTSNSAYGCSASART